MIVRTSRIRAKDPQVYIDLLNSMNNEFFSLYLEGKPKFELTRIDVQNVSSLARYGKYHDLVKALDKAPMDSSFAIIINGDEGFLTEMEAWVELKSAYPRVKLYLAVHEAICAMDEQYKNWTADPLNGGWVIYPRVGIYWCMLCVDRLIKVWQESSSAPADMNYEIHFKNMGQWS